ncbi:MAG: hypothetical protein GQ532_14445 [Methylomarinum sp.]|nr:hypothetical protein [Methylomarinum sp.]
MNINNNVFEFLFEIIKVILLVGLVASVGISFPTNADEQGGGIVVLRYVPQRSAIRPSIVPGKTIFVSTSPDKTVINATRTAKPNAALDQLNELDEEDFAGISSNIPQINFDINSSNISTGVSSSSGFNSNMIQSAQGIRSNLGGVASATGSVRRATSSIGRSIQGVTGILSPR